MKTAAEPPRLCRWCVNMPRLRAERRGLRYDAVVRNGRQAVGLAERLAATTGRKDPAVLDVLAAAYAEVGRWDEAVAAGRLT